MPLFPIRFLSAAPDSFALSLPIAVAVELATTTAAAAADSFF